MKPEKTNASIAYATILVAAITDNYTLLYPDCLGDPKLFIDRLAEIGKRPDYAKATLPPCIDLAIANVIDDASPTPLIERVIILDRLLREYLGLF